MVVDNTHTHTIVSCENLFSNFNDFEPFDLRAFSDLSDPNPSVWINNYRIIMKAWNFLYEIRESFWCIWRLIKTMQYFNSACTFLKLLFTPNVWNIIWPRKIICLIGTFNLILSWNIYLNSTKQWIFTFKFLKNTIKQSSFTKFADRRARSAHLCDQFHTDDRDKKNVCKMYTFIAIMTHSLSTDTIKWHYQMTCSFHSVSIYRVFRNAQSICINLQTFSNCNVCVNTTN